MAFLVSSTAAWSRRVAGWFFAVEERLADLVLVGGGFLVFMLAAGAWGATNFWSLSDLQEGTLWLVVVVLGTIWLLILAVFHHQGWLRVFGPLLFYDLVRIARRSRYLLMRFLYGLLLGLLVCWLFLMFRLDHKGNIASREMADFAENFFYMFVFVQFFVACLLTPAYTAGAVAEEKERRTLEFVLATDLRNREIVLSKLTSRLANLSLLVLTGLPILSFLQFLGGVDPNLVLASFAATGMTMVSLAALSIVNSVLTRRARDAIALTYLGAAGYLALSGASWILLNPDWGLAKWPSENSSINLEDAVYGFNAGNPIALIILLVEGMSRNVHIATMLPGLLRKYAIFHGLLTIVCTVFAVLRLRAIALRQAQGDTRGASSRRRFWRRPRIGFRPMLWKEIFVERGLQLHVLTRVFVALLVLASLVPVGFIFAEFLGELNTRGGGGRAGNPYQLSAAMNVYVRILGTTVACLMLLAVGARAAGSVSGERDRQTLDALLTSPLEISAILYAKWIGNILTVRKAWLWLGAIYLLGLATGGLHPFALPLLLVAWFVYGAVVSAMGIWFSIVSRTTLRATIWTLFTTAGAALGHWLLWMCCAPIFIYAGNPEGAYLRWVLSFQVGMTPPAVLGYAFSFSIEDFSGQYSQSREMGEALGFGILGLIIWAVIAAVIWAAASSRLATITGRLGLAPAQLPRNSMPRLDARPESPDDAKLDVRDSTVG